jgi:hypothetical protein
MKDNFDIKKFLVENQTGPYAKAKVKSINESETIYVYGDDGYTCYRVDDEGNRDEVSISYCKMYAGQGVREDMGKDLEDTEAAKQMDFLSEKDKVKEEVQIKQKQYYQIYDAGMDEWHDDYQYIGKIAMGSSTGFEGEYMFMSPDAPGSFSFVSIDDAHLNDMVRPTKNGINETLSSSNMERMEGLVPQTPLKALIGGAKAIIRDFKEEGFEEDEIFDYLISKIKTLDEGYMGTQYDSSEDMADDMVKKGITREADMFSTGGSINPELRKKVEQFVKGVAKYYDYSVDDAFLAITTILKGGLQNK